MTTDRRPDLAGILSTLESLFDLTITLHDPAGIFTGPGCPPLPREQTYHRAAFCRAGRYRSSSYDHSCLSHCLREVETEAGRTRETFVHRCWKGACEIVIPVYVGQTHAATLFAGLFRGGRAPTGIDNRHLPVLTPEKERQIGTLLRAAVYGLLHEQKTDLPPRSRGEQIQHYLRLHAHLQPTLAELAAELKLSPSRTSHAVRELCGCNFQTLLNRIRLGRACEMLHTTDYTIERIALSTGFRSGGYLHRMFRREMHATPDEFRRARQKTGEKQPPG